MACGVSEAQRHQPAAMAESHTNCGISFRNRDSVRMSATNSTMATPSNACRIVVRCASGDVGRLPKRRIGAQQFHLDGLAVARRHAANGPIVDPLDGGLLSRPSRPWSSYRLRRLPACRPIHCRAPLPLKNARFECPPATGRRRPVCVLGLQLSSLLLLLLLRLLLPPARLCRPLIRPCAPPSGRSSELPPVALPLASNHSLTPSRIFFNKKLFWHYRLTCLMGSSIIEMQAKSLRL